MRGEVLYLYCEVGKPNRMYEAGLRPARPDPMSYAKVPICTVAGCGDMWQDGERLERPFCPGWRSKNIQHAREMLAFIGVQA